MKKIFIFTLLVACSTTSFADQICQGLLEDITINNNLKVMQDCKLARVKVDGNIILLQNASLKVLNSEIKGNIESKGTFKSIEATNNHIKGNIDLENGQNIRLLGNNVSGNIEIEKNQGAIFIQNNRISGDLECEQNTVTPRGGQNYVRGDKEHQCRAL